MSYAPASALQAAVYQRLRGDTAISAAVGAAIYDQVPAGTLPGTYVTLGPETAQTRRDSSGQSTRHDFTISVHTDAGGFQGIKSLAGAITEALQDAPLDLAQGRITALEFRRARARRLGNGALRQIDLWFRAQVENT
jgi:hypothetical protein